MKHKSSGPAVPPPAERRRRLEARYPTWQPRTLSQALDAAAAEFGDRPFVITDERTYTYRDIQDWARRIASGLVARGVKPGDHVALILANYPEYVAVKFAIAKAGAVAVPINFLLRRQELTYILEQSDTTILLTMDRLRDRDYLADLDAMIPGWDSNQRTAALPRLRDVFVLPAAGPLRAGVRTLQDLAQLGTTETNHEVVGREQSGDPNFRSDVIYTSGTTGRPKGVMLTHEMILRVSYASAYWRAFEDGRRFVFALPMYHVFGYIECLIASTFVGGAVIPQVQFDPERLLEAAERHRASEIDCVPLMTMKLLDAARKGGFDNSHMVSVFNSGGVNPPTIWEEIRDVLGGREIATGYGMTETSATTTCTQPEDPLELQRTTNGRLKLAGAAGDPALNGMLAIYKSIDPETGADLAFGQRGELVVRGPIVTKGYYKKPEETAAAFTRDGWLHTGDVGTISAEGHLVFLGRIKETYRCGGEMVMPREIEEILNEHPLVAQALVVGVPDEKMGEVGCVCVVAKADRRPDPDDLIGICAKRLAKFKVPRHVLFVSAEDIPLTPTGRPQKFRLAELAKQRLSATSRAA
jgi:fatty-acyl-CoA synthase